jgi:hypothetical protein
LFLGRKHPTEDTKNVTQTVATVVAEMSHSQVKFPCGDEGMVPGPIAEFDMGSRSRAGSGPQVPKAIHVCGLPGIASIAGALLTQVNADARHFLMLKA